MRFPWGRWCLRLLHLIIPSLIFLGLFYLKNDTWQRFSWHLIGFFYLRSETLHWDLRGSVVLRSHSRFPSKAPSLCTQPSVLQSMIWPFQVHININCWKWLNWSSYSEGPCLCVYQIKLYTGFKGIGMQRHVSGNIVSGMLHAKWKWIVKTGLNWKLLK